MTIAREQAVEVALAEHDPEAGLGPRDVLLNAADAVSDVWEPLLRELAEAVQDDFHPHNSRGKRTRLALNQAKEALGQ